MHVCACGDKSMDGLWLNWDSEKTNLEMEADRSKYCCTISAGCLRLCDQFWVASPPPSSTWQIGIFSPLPLKRANRAAGRELMDGRQPGAQVMLPLFFFFFFSVPAYCRLFSWFLPGDRSAMPSKCFFLSVPVHSYRSNLTQGYLIWGFFFFSFLATPPPHAPRHRPIILLLNSLPPPPSQWANIPPPSIPAQFADSFLFLRGGLCSCWCLWFRPMAQLPRS